MPMPWLYVVRAGSAKRTERASSAVKSYLCAFGVQTVAASNGRIVSVEAISEQRLSFNCLHVALPDALRSVATHKKYQRMYIVKDTVFISGLHVNGQ
uniref:Uncharacterized protein n=1 Tax=Anopheles dirus TaxID=7168 RepID=A0A182NXV8_9DIPT